MRAGRVDVLLVLAFCLGCARQDERNPPSLFSLVHPGDSGIDFINQLAFDQEFNVYTYRNFYNGGGVALGDVNNDGLVDVYLTANMSGNRLYLNKGEFHFEDITENAGVSGTMAWSTGVSMADVNADGWIDIYVCNSGDLKGGKRQNELFLNNGDLTFSERAKEYNIHDEGYTTHAAFLDYDKDGDLDLYILNNSYQAIGSFNLRKNERPKRDLLGGDKLMRNDGERFTDVSEAAGIYGSVIGFGLGVTVGDIDKDGWPDIYVSNDFFERDYLYINNGNGSFRECLTEQMKSISGASMGADLADVNNDGYADIFVTEMLPMDNARLKTVTTFENWDRYQYNVKNDYYHQFTRNTLQLNNGNGTFAEIGRLAGVEATDWSWGALMFDMDNDGLRDIFVANGIYQDLTNQDYLQYISNEEVVKSIISGSGVDYKKLVELIPSTPVKNFAFQNMGGLEFADQADAWGLGTPDFSNGSAYGDLDNDGDLDLVINNVNSTASVYRNNATELRPENRYLRFELFGVGKNSNAFGAKITIQHDTSTFYVEQMPIRGFESSVDPRPFVGLGKIDTVDQVVIEWPDGIRDTLKSVVTNQNLKLHQKNVGAMRADRREAAKDPPPSVFRKVEGNPIDFAHRENEFVDFDRDRLTFLMLSTEGPRLSKGDANGDGLDDLFVGGAKDAPGALFVQTSAGRFVKTNQEMMEKDQASEDMGSEFFDADGDRDQDLFVCSGGNEFSTSSMALASRLYINNGTGKYRRSPQLLPAGDLESASTVKSADFDGDGDLDLFVGIRVRPFLYGVPVNGYILRNDGRGNFANVSAEVAPVLRELGMITDAAWADIDNDSDHDLIVVGEYMPVRVLINTGGKLADQTDKAGLQRSAGFWNRIEKGDLDLDGDIDFVIGNHGRNSRLRGSGDQPLCMYVNDFDQNGTVEHVVCTFSGEGNYPLALRHDLISQMPFLKKKYLLYESFKDQTVDDIFTPGQLESAITLKAYELSTSVLVNEGNGKFKLTALPVEAQLSPIYGIEIGDFDRDNNPDIVLGGNLYGVKPEIGRYDASYGVMLRGDGKANFRALSAAESGFMVDGEIRDVISISNGDKSFVIVARNNASIITLSFGK